MNITLLQDDCLQSLKKIQDQSIYVVTDPPYGIGENSYRVANRAKLAKTKDYGEFDWDKERVSKEYIDEILRIAIEAVIFGGNFYSDWLPVSASWIIWDKENSGGFADCELAWTSHKRAARKISWMWNGMIRRGNEERFHPTQKPLGVMRWVIENYTPAEAMVIDPFMGSGTTGVACMQLGRGFIGIEKKHEYFVVAQDRIQKARMQMSLFSQVQP